MKPTYFLVLTMLISCGKKAELNDSTVFQITEPIRTKDVRLDSVDVHIVTFDTSYQYVFPNTFLPASLSKEELVRCEAIVSACVATYNKTIAQTKLERQAELSPGSNLSLSEFTISLNEYGRQYMPAISDNGDKIVFVSCFCDPASFDYRNRTLVYVYDGGKCYFTLKINLSGFQVLDFFVNGAA